MFSTSAYLLAAGVAAVLSAAFTVAVRAAARALGIVDDPRVAADRKVHQAPIPLLGGIAIFGSFSLVVLGYAFFSGRLVGDALPLKYLLGLIIGGGILMVGGALDDWFRLPARAQIVFPFFAALVIVAAGIGPKVLSNPLGGVIRLDGLEIPLLTIGSTPYFLTLPADLFTVLWLFLLMYTTKLLDGLDGLVAGTGVIASVIIFLLSLHPDVVQPGTAMLAAILAGASLGFLVFNWHPASIFLGEGGSVFIGFVLGVLSIIAGGKIATALLIFGVPILDVFWVVAWRIFKERRSPFTVGDRQHLHFRLLAYGLSHRQTVLLFWLLSGAFGTMTLLFSGQGKVAALAALTVVTVALGFTLSRRKRAGAA